MNAQEITRLKDLAQKLATEVVFAEPGKDTGLLPVNCLLGQLEELVGATAAPSALARAVQCARRWVDDIFASDAVFSAEALGRFNAWTSWVQKAACTLEQQQPVPTFPESWTRPASEGAAAETAPPTTPPDAAPSESEPVLVIGAEADAELLREFLNESAEHLQNIEQGVLVLEEDPTDAATLNSIFRAFHTFKGGSGLLNLAPIQTLAHQLESLLEAARTGRLVISSPIANVILEGGDTLKRLLSEIEARISGKTASGPIQVPTLNLLARIREILEGERLPANATASPTLPAPAPSPKEEPSAAPAAQLWSPEVTVAATAPTNSLAFPKVSVPAGGRPTDPAVGKGAASASAAAVKVDTNKLDNLVDLVGELVIAQSLVVQSRALKSLEDQQLSRDLAQMGRITKELQRTAMSLRMVPIRSTFQKMNRLVRDIAAKTSKQVELAMEGEETELDRNIVEEIGDPLVHMVRNAIDHGIEKPELRIQRGKPVRGTVLLRAFYQGGDIVVEIKDDGNGLDKQRLLKKGIEKGLVSPDAILDEDEIFNLIFAPGLSTAEQVTDLSGRGVGMDVVRRNIEKLRGKIEIQSTLGQGSTFRIYLPLTLAIIDGLIVGVGNERYILPTLSVSESFRPTAGMISRVHGRGEMLSVRGRLRPVLRLHEHLGVPAACEDATQSIAVVVEAGKESRCVLVDRLLGKQEVVIKNLGEALRRSPMLAGAAILGDGRVGLILDPNALVHLNSNIYSQAA